jgi:hypothetical protein
LTPERFQRICQLYHLALELAPDARASFLRAFHSQAEAGCLRASEAIFRSESIIPLSFNQNQDR